MERRSVYHASGTGVDTDLTENDLIRALLEAQGEEDNPEGALTTKEMVRRLGWSQYQVYTTFDELIQSGHEIEVVRVRRRNRAGRISVVPAYRLKMADSGEGLP